MTTTWARLSAAILGLALLGVHTLPAVAQNYTLTSLVSANFSPANFSVSSINNHGHVAWQSWNAEGDSIIVVHDGSTASVVFNLTDAGFGAAVGDPVINDAGAVAIRACGGWCVVRINADRTATVLATMDPVDGTGDFREISSYWPSMNNSGQAALTVIKHNGAQAVVRVDDTGITEIATQTATLINFSWPSINDSGRVAFSALQLNPEQPVIYSGVGGALTLEGSTAGLAPVIRNDGLILDSGGGSPALIYTAQGGIVNVLVIGNEDPVLGAIDTTLGVPTQNDLGNFVFGSRGGFDFGLFTGNDPRQHTVIRKGDILLGWPVVILQTGRHNLNNAGQIVFLVLVESPDRTIATYHLVRADDATPPVAGAVIPANTQFGTFVDSPFDLTATFTDSESPVTSCQYTTDGGSTWNAASVSGHRPTYTCTKTGITGTDGQVLTLNMRATSGGGTGAGIALTRTVDAAAPITSDNAPAGWVATDQAVTLAPSDGPGSGVASTQYCIDTANSCAPVTSGTLVAVTCGPGAACQTYVRYRSADNVGNVEPTRSTLVKIDKASPSTSIVSGPGPVATGTVTFTWTGTDNITPTASLVYAYRLDPIEPDWSTWTSNPTATYTGLSNDLYTFLVKARDEVGNEDPTPASRSFTVACPAVLALSGVPHQEGKLSVLYDVRDRILAPTLVGQRYVDLFYKHAMEGAWLMLRDPRLRASTRTLVEHFLPTARAMLAGQPAMVTQSDLALVQTLFDGFSAAASPQLRSDLETIKQELRRGTILRRFGIRVVE